MIMNFEIVKREFQLINVYIINRRVSVLSAFENKIFKFFFSTFSWSRDWVLYYDEINNNINIDYVEVKKGKMRMF